MRQVGVRILILIRISKPTLIPTQLIVSIKAKRKKRKEKEEEVECGCVGGRIDKDEKNGMTTTDEGGNEIQQYKNMKEKHTLLHVCVCVCVCQMDTLNM